MALMAGPIPIAQVAKDAQALSLADFGAAYGPMVLVRMKSGIDAAVEEQNDDDRWSFGTVHDVKSRESGPLGGIMDLQGGVAFPVRKVHSRFFARTILLGRSASNDIHIADPGISKLHARFRFDGERLLLGDAGSSNGTFVNGKRITEERAVQDSDVLSFGALRFRLLASPNLHAILRRLGSGA